MQPAKNSGLRSVNGVTDYTKKHADALLYAGLWLHDFSREISQYWWRCRMCSLKLGHWTTTNVIPNDNQWWILDFATKRHVEKKTCYSTDNKNDAKGYTVHIAFFVRSMDKSAVISSFLSVSMFPFFLLLQIQDYSTLLYNVSGGFFLDMVNLKTERRDWKKNKLNCILNNILHPLCSDSLCLLQHPKVQHQGLMLIIFSTHQQTTSFLFNLHKLQRCWNRQSALI